MQLSTSLRRLSVFLIGCLILVLGRTAKAQTFFETQFSHKGVSYVGLFIFYDDNDAIMRLKYTRGLKGYTVAEFECKGETFTLSDGTNGYFLDGQNGRKVYPEVVSGFTAYNFIFYKDRNGNLGTPYVVDDITWRQSNSTADLQEVTYWREVDPSEKFTPQYVYNFFDKGEELYNIMLSLNPSNHLADHDSGSGGSGTSTAGEPALPTDDKWAVVMSKGVSYGDEIMRNDHEWPDSWVTSNTASGYAITEIAYGAQNYVVTMAKGTGYRDQTHKSFADWPSGWIQSQWNQRKYLTSVTYGNGKWSLVTSGGTRFTDQEIITDQHFPLRDVSRLKVQGYYITNLAYGPDKWVVVMSKGVEYPSQIWSVRDEYPQEWIDTKTSQGYAVTEMMFGDEEWVTVMSKGTGYTQTFEGVGPYPKDFIVKQQQQGYRITQLVYSGGPGMYYGQVQNTQETNTIYTGNSRLHLIMVANTRVSDIGASCENDKNKVVREFENISDALGIPLEQHLVIEDRYSKEILMQTIRTINANKNDIIVFIYTGHGFRWQNQVSEYPMIDLTYSNYQQVDEETSMNLDEVHDLLIKKGARLTLVLGDCCNSSVGRSSRAGASSLASRPNERSRMDRLRTLFLEMEGHIIAAAAQPDETACGNAQTGGYFLNSFFSALHKETSYLYEEEPSWNAIFERTMENAAYKTQRLDGCSPQHGIFKSAVPE